MKKSKDTLLEEIRIAWLLGYSYSNMAEMFNKSVKQIKKLVHEDLGRAQQYAFPDEVYEDMKYLYEVERWTYKDIAEYYQISPGNVRFHMHRVGAQIRRRGWRYEKDQEYMDTIPKRRKKR